MQVGANSSQITAEIAAAPPAITAVQGLRSAGTIEVRVTGYDNTRSVSQLSFTFYDGSGRVMAPGAFG